MRSILCYHSLGEPLVFLKDPKGGRHFSFGQYVYLFRASTSINTAKRRNSLGERSLIFHFAIMDLPLVQRTHHSFRVNNPFMKNIHDTGTHFFGKLFATKIGKTNTNANVS